MIWDFYGFLKQIRTGLWIVDLVFEHGEGNASSKQLAADRMPLNGLKHTVWYSPTQVNPLGLLVRKDITSYNSVPTDLTRGDSVTPPSTCLTGAHLGEELLDFLQVGLLWPRAILAPFLSTEESIGVKRLHNRRKPLTQKSWSGCKPIARICRNRYRDGGWQPWSSDNHSQWGLANVDMNGCDIPMNGGISKRLRFSY